MRKNATDGLPLRGQGPGLVGPGRRVRPRGAGRGGGGGRLRTARLEGLHPTTSTRSLRYKRRAIRDKI